ncbi:MAG: 5-formyltetrahydrofolate cyclo-ligase [Prevotellaceae bacterium]|nr:5-formyltetrahydrofolate cyclo-ligase [Prevotellaceae bacterium]
MNKQEIRAMMTARKKAYNAVEIRDKSVKIILRLKETEEFRRAKSILLYWSMPGEVYTHDLAVETIAGKSVFLPVVSGNNLLIREFTGVGDLKEGQAFSILEPAPNAKEADIADIDLALVPGLAFDLKGGRLGRGKGYYDKLLSCANLYKIGVCFDFQLLDKIPCDEHDVLMDKVITG